MRDYKKILEDVVNIVSTSENSVAANIRAYIDENCPELKEGKDERIIKALKEGFKYHQLFNPTFGGIPCNEIVNWLEKQGKERKITHEEICKSYGISDIGEFSDGYHTFNSLYKQRMILFAVLVKTYKDRAWKSWKHEDGLDCFGGGWFIVGIDTPAGTYTYHYEAKDWDRFDCRILDKAKHWDGHDEFDVERLFSLAEKQGEQKPVIEIKSAEESLGIDSETYNKIVDDCIYGDCEQRPADKAEPKFKVKYANSEYNVLEIKEIAGVTFYGIEDEPNHIDYVKAENCKIISDYSIKENGSSYPTKPAVFSGQNSAWSEEDEATLDNIISDIRTLQSKSKCSPSDRYYAIFDEEIDWLKSLKERVQPQNIWKPNDVQMKILLSEVEAWTKGCPKQKVLESLYNDLKKLK